MSKEKHKHHGKKHDHHKHHEPTLGEQYDAGSDMPQSAQQVEEEKTKAKNLHAQVVAISEAKGGTKVNINAGSMDGVQAGMAAYLVGPKGENFADITIIDVGDQVCHAIVEGLSEQQLYGVYNAVINP